MKKEKKISLEDLDPRETIESFLDRIEPNMTKLAGALGMSFRTLVSRKSSDSENLKVSEIVGLAKYFSLPAEQVFDKVVFSILDKKEKGLLAKAIRKPLSSKPSTIDSFIRSVTQKDNLADILGITADTVNTRENDPSTFRAIELYNLAEYYSIEPNEVWRMTLASIQAKQGSRQSESIPIEKKTAKKDLNGFKSATL